MTMDEFKVFLDDLIEANKEDLKHSYDERTKIFNKGWESALYFLKDQLNKQNKEA